jgi:aspartate aminotransferase-like enzyme
VLDCIASGNVWVDMEQNFVDVLISAPQKGWSGTFCYFLGMFLFQITLHFSTKYF